MCRSMAVVQHVVAHGAYGVADVVARQQLVALLVDHLALVVRHVVVFEQLLADVEVALFDLALRVFDRARHPRMLDRLALGHLQAVHDRGDAVGGEDAQQRVFQRQEEAAGTGVALAPGTTAQLVVDATRFVAFGADDVQAAGRQHGVVAHLPVGLERGGACILLAVRQRFVVADRVEFPLDAAAQHDVGAAARHVGGDGDTARHPRLRDDLGFALVLLGVQHVVRQPGFFRARRRVVRWPRSRWCPPAPAGRVRGRRGPR